MRPALLAIPALLLVPLAGPPRAAAQPGPDVADFALDWARGSFASPVVCRFGDDARRGLRRIVITPGPRHSPVPVNRLQFVDLGADRAARCHNELGGEEPNVIGTLYLSYVAKRQRSATPKRDFQQELERGELRYRIERGALRIGSAEDGNEAMQQVDFESGTATLDPIARGSDDARRLGDLPGLRRVRLALEAPDGTSLAFPLVELEPR